MTEFIIGATLVMLPLYLAVQAMGKFAEVKHMTQAAARYAAWERTVWFNETGSPFYQKNKPNQKSDAQIRSEIAIRLFNDRNSDSPLSYSDTDKTAAGFGKQGIDPLWEDTAGQAYLTDYDKITLTGNVSKPSKDIVGSALDLISKVSIPHVTGTLVPPVPTETLVQTTFELHDVASESDVYRRLWSRVKGMGRVTDPPEKDEEWVGFSTKGQAAVLTNAWNANSSQGTLAMVQESVPTAQGLGQALETGARAIIYSWDPVVGFLHPLDLGKIGPDVVPPDRLK